MAPEPNQKPSNQNTRRQPGEESREGDEHGNLAQRQGTEARQGSIIKRRPMTRVLVLGIILVVVGFALAARLVF